MERLAPPQLAGSVSITDRLARSVIETGYEQLERTTVEQAKLRVIDIVGCMIGGLHVSGTAMLRDTIVHRGGRSEATIAITGGRVPASSAALVNSIMARGNDFGVLIPYIGSKPVWSHISESTVPAALAMTEKVGGSGRDLLGALILGDDLTTRLAAAASYTPGSGWDGPGIVNKFGVAAIAGRLGGLDARGLVDAFGIVLNQLAGSFQAIDDGAHTFKLAQGLAARDGIEAAELAATGWTGSRDPLFGKNGYFDLYCGTVNPEALTDDLGERFYGDETYKPYPACRFTHSTIDCALDLLAQGSVDLDQVDEIVIDVASMHIDSPLDQPFAPGRYPQAHAIFSLRYAAASALTRGSATLADYTDQAVQDPRISELTARTRVTGGQSLATPEAASLSVVMNDGRVINARRDTATGNPLTSPLDEAAIEAKFRDQCDFANVFTAGRVDALLDALRSLDELPRINMLTHLLRPDR